MLSNIHIFLLEHNELVNVISNALQFEGIY